MTPQIPQRISHQRLQAARYRSPERFDYSLNYKSLDLRAQPDLYRVGRGEEGVLLVEPYKGELLPLWRFRNPDVASKSAKALLKKFEQFKVQKDFVGMDMARKFIQMGYTRSRRYANHQSGRKYSETSEVLPQDFDSEKAESAEIFRQVWKSVEADPVYADMKLHWKLAFG